MRHKNWLAIGFLIFWALPALAHKLPCAHSHNGLKTDAVVTCTDAGATCTVKGKTGTCTQRQTRVRTLCSCDVPESGCLGIASIFFDGYGGSLPSPGATLSYDVASSPLNNFSAILGEETFDFDPGVSSFFGFVILSFNSDLTRATVTDIFLDATLNALMTIGIRLPAGEDAELLYNSATMTLDTIDENGIDVELISPLGTQAATAFLDVEIDDEGDAFALVQIDAPLPNIFADGFESGDATAWR